MPISRRMLKRELSRQNELLEKHNLILNHLRLKASMPDNIWQIEDVLFFVPNYPADFIQSLIVNHNQFYESDILDDLNQFIHINAVICDIGANIGNHTLYWLTRTKAKFVYCFEPRNETFKILEKNIEINKLQEKAQCFNFALSDATNSLSSSFFDQHDIGRNAYEVDESGDIVSYPLDEIGLTKKIDFIKIDVEGMEMAVLHGARNIISQHQPLMLIEAFGNNYHQVSEFLYDLGYKKIKDYPHYNYLYAVKD